MRNAVSTPSSGVAARAGSRPAILWIDDQPDELGLLRFLSLEGFSITTATTGTGGLALAKARRYEAIVVDLHLPDLHGLTVVERLRANGISCPVVAVTGHYLDPETPHHAYEAGATIFHYRPLWPDETAEALREVVGQRISCSPDVRRFPVEWAVQPIGERLPENAHTGETTIARLLARLDRLASTAPTCSEECSRDLLLAALLSALADTALPLSGVRGCAEALHIIFRARGIRREDVLARTRDVVGEATHHRLTARHPSVRKALAVLHNQPRWWEEGDLAKEVQVSRSHFARMVHQDTGLDYRSLRRLVVMRAGVTEVLNTDERFAQIAYQLGMQPGRFDEVFGEIFGCSPRELRGLWIRLRPLEGRRHGLLG